MHEPEKRHRQWLTWLHVVAFTSILSIGGCVRSSVLQETPEDVACERRLKRIWNLIDKYRAVNGRWPQDFTSPDGHTHSWRVLIAPYRVAHSNPADVFSSIGYNFSEPWDSEHNIAAIHRLPLWGSLVCTSESRNASYPNTSYLMLKRPEMSSEVLNTLPSDAVIVVESVNCGVGWGEPRDLTWNDLFEGESPFGERKLNSLHRGVVKALRADGKVIDIPKNIDKRKLEQLLMGTPL